MSARTLRLAGVCAMFLAVGPAAAGTGPEPSSQVADAFGAWRSNQSHSESDECAGETVKISAIGAQTKDGQQPVTATFSSAKCDAEVWHGMALLQGGRAMVALRPAPVASGKLEVHQSVSLWLSADACELGGVTKNESNLRIIVYRSISRCPVAKGLAPK